MDKQDLILRLSRLPLGEVRFFDCLGSTSDYALDWARNGAGDLSLVVAGSQSEGRGKNGTRWYMTPGTGLVFSLILAPVDLDRFSPNLITGLGALSVAKVLELLGLEPQIKWPNDVLLGGKKVTGVLTDIDWLDGVIQNAVLGIGMNVQAGSTPADDLLSFPATTLDDELGSICDHWLLLEMILTEIIKLRTSLGQPKFITAWEQRLAFRGKIVEIHNTRGIRTGVLDGLNQYGQLRIIENGQPALVEMGDVHLRQVL